MGLDLVVRIRSLELRKFIEMLEIFGLRDIDFLLIRLFLCLMWILDYFFNLIEYTKCIDQTYFKKRLLKYN